ncbi:MAG: hypothetical protein XD91_1617 [Clostridiales bacterium 38_11]|nr:MAG: hypothetical protein XD91_1617 [Clostridiales bacterium 38_11]HBH13363.1 hypothetical protein [Clostridiales bacterium]
MKTSTDEKTSWQINVPIFKNILILKQLMIAIGIPFGIVILVLFFTSIGSGSRDAFYGIGLIILLMLVTAMFIMIVFGGKYAVEFEMDENGITCKSQEHYRQKSTIIGFLTIILSIFSKNPTTAGAGLLSQTKHVVRIRWSKIREIKFYPKYQTILIKEDALSSLGIFCTKDNYTAIAAYIKNRV